MDRYNTLLGGWLLFMFGTLLCEGPMQYHLFRASRTDALTTLRIIHSIVSLLHILGFGSVMAPVYIAKQPKQRVLKSLETVRSTVAFQIFFWMLGAPWCLVESWWRFWGLLICLGTSHKFIRLIRGNK